MGDAATAATCYTKALEYYEKMLYYAEKDKSNEAITAALVSLSRTFKDAKRYEEALIFAKREFEMCSDSSEACRSALFLADLSESAGLTINEISNFYKLALSKAETSGDPLLEYSVLKNYLVYLENKENYFTEAESLKERLNLIEDKIPKIESEVESLENFDIDDDILLDELSDLEEEEEEGSNKEKEIIEKQKRELRKRKKGLSMKKNEKGETPLHVACINGNIEMVEKLIDNGHPINVQDNAGWTPLHESANHGFVEIAKLLINAGANISDPGGPKTGGITPLHDAASCGEFSVINLLIDKGADIYAVTKNGETILDCLEDWKSRAGDLTAAIESEYQFIRKKLSSKGVTRKREKKQAADETLIIDDKRNRNRVNLLDGSDEDDEEKDEDIANISAGEDYKRTIAVLRNRGAQPGPSTKFSPVKDELPPLIDSEQILADEWLEDDIGIFQMVNKKRNSWNDPLSMTKRKNESVTTEERERKRQKVYIEDNVASLDICDDEDEDEGSCETEIVEVLEPPAREPTKLRKRKKQTSLLSVGFLRDTESRTPSPISEIIPRKNLEEKIEIVKQYLNLNIVIDRRIIELRLHVSDEKKIITENVVKEVEKKFEEDTGCFPRFHLIGPHDIILNSQDLIEDFSSIGNSITFNTVIRDMNIPLISERYGKICAASNVGENASFFFFSYLFILFSTYHSNIQITANLTKTIYVLDLEAPRTVPKFKEDSC